MASIGTGMFAPATLVVPEYAMDARDVGNIAPVTTAPSAPTDGSVLLAFIVNGAVTFDQGDRRLAVFAGGTNPYDGTISTSAGAAQAPVGWIWASGDTT